MRAMILDDEPFARSRLRRLLGEHGVDVVGEFASAPDGLLAVQEHRPDVLFLDIQMPNMSGMEMAAALEHVEQPPLLVFVTGYSEHAVTAFEHMALDYLMKPVSSERLAVTLVRAAQRMADRAARTAAERRARAHAARRLAADRLPIRVGFSITFVPVNDILALVSRSRKVSVVTSDAEYATTYTLRELVALLPCDRFMRIHDSCIVDLRAIRALDFLGDHSYQVRLSNDLQLPVSRARYAELSRRLGLTSDASS